METCVKKLKMKVFDFVIEYDWDLNQLNFVGLIQKTNHE